MLAHQHDVAVLIDDFEQVNQHSMGCPPGIIALVLNRETDMDCVINKNRAANVAVTRVTSCGEALEVWMARGRPARSATAMSFVPLPRLVLPTARPPFWRR